MEDMSMNTIIILATLIAIVIFALFVWENNRILERKSRERIARINAKQRTVIQIVGDIGKGNLPVEKTMLSRFIVLRNNDFNKQ